jgi:hypothetical protein
MTPGNNPETLIHNNKHGESLQTHNLQAVYKTSPVLKQVLKILRSGPDALTIPKKDIVVYSPKFFPANC